MEGFASSQEIVPSSVADPNLLCSDPDPDLDPASHIYLDPDPAPEPNSI